ncbi:P-loop containing nucleoside triphosphate hydrolase protein, partial [Caulochytrium protostelioides]
MPVSVVLEDMRSKSYVLNVIDTPGHTDFADEMVAGVRLADGAVLVVDVVEGVTLPTKRIITHLVSEGVPFIVVMNKLDRLITELRIPPADAYFKIRHSIEEVNQVLRELGSSERKSPERGNVLFASTAFGWCFSLASFARIYRERMVVRVQPRHGAKAAPTFDPARFAQCLWGNVYYDADNHHFTKQPVRAATAHAGAAKLPRSFLAFILEPLYKIVAQTLGENPRDLQTTLAQLNIRLRGDELKQDAAPLMRLIFHRFFGGPTLFTKRVSQTVSERQAIACGVDGLVSAVVAHLPSPCDPSAVAPRWTDHLYTGPAMAAAAASSDDAAMPADPFRQAIAACSHADDAPVLIHVAKSVNFASTREFEVLGRVLSGTVRPGMRLSVMGESYVPDEDEEEVQTVTVGDLAIFNTRYSLPVAEVTAGNWLLMRGVDGNITKTATL